MQEINQLFFLYNSRYFLSRTNKISNISSSLCIMVLCEPYKGITSPSPNIFRSKVLEYIYFDIRVTIILKIEFIGLYPDQWMPFNKLCKQYSTLIVIIQANKLKYCLTIKYNDSNTSKSNVTSKGSGRSILTEAESDILSYYGGSSPNYSNLIINSGTFNHRESVNIYSYYRQWRILCQKSNTMSKAKS